jgi:hypothetical protein
LEGTGLSDVISCAFLLAGDKGQPHHCWIDRTRGNGPTIPEATCLGLVSRCPQGANRTYLMTLILASNRQVEQDAVRRNVRMRAVAR